MKKDQEERMNKIYKDLQADYQRAMGVCDPLDYLVRQNCLLYSIAGYLLERDKPQELIEKDRKDRIDAEKMGKFLGIDEIKRKKKKK